MYIHVLVLVCAILFFIVRRPKIISAEDDQGIIDRYTICHIGTGFLYNCFGRLLKLEGEPLLLFGILCSSLWEVIENNNEIIAKYIKNKYPDYIGDSLDNSISDILMAALAFYISILAPKWYFSLAGFIVCDVFSEIVFKDSTVLGIYRTLKSSSQS